ISGPQAGVARLVSGVAGEASVRRAKASVVRVLGTACGLGIEGSGWVVGPGEVVTNAHVVAGEHDTAVEVGGSPPNLKAEVVVFDPRNDIAVLAVAGLDARPLALASDPPAGRSAAILGYPKDGPFDAEPGRIGRTQPVDTQDAYGRGPVTRLLTPIRGLVRPGNSGGPMVDSTGAVVTTVFAATTDGGPSGGFGVANSTVVHDLAQAGGRVSTQGCSE